MDPDTYCRDKVAGSGSSFALSFLFLPPDQRRAITALYAFCREVDDVVDECSEPEVARATLQWWRDEVERALAGQAEHPVMRALHPFIERFGLPAEHFLEIIDGMEMDLDLERYATFTQLSLYCYRVAGVVGLLSAQIFGYSDRRTLKYAHNLGMAFQLTNILRDVNEDLRRGRVYLPVDEMKQFGVSVDELAEKRVSENVRRLFEFQGQRAERYYQQAMELLPPADRYRQRSGLIMAAIYAALLKRIQHEGYEVLERRVRLPHWRKLWIAWSTARAEERRHRSGGSAPAAASRTGSTRRP